MEQIKFGDWRSLMMRLQLAAGILILAFAGNAFGQNSLASKSKLEYCYDTYALCTIAKCAAPTVGSPIPPSVQCDCTVSTGYSVGKKCKDHSDPLNVLSRYSPIFSYQECPGVTDGNMAVWANCVNAPCKIDPNNTGFATCTCKTATSTSPFVLATDHPNPAGCKACTVDSHGHSDCPQGLYSSATIGDAQNITTLIQDKIGDIKVFPPPN